MNVFELYAKIALDTGDYEKGLEDASGKTSSFADKLKTGLSAAAKVGAAAIGAASTGIAALTKSSIEGYAEYEQLVGGAQKIFDQMDYSKIANDANNAYKELGLSANQYLSVINDVGATFAATMGDKAGYEAAKTGLKAISDYASGTGKNVDELSQKFTLITRSTSSYQSIADQFSGILPATSAGFLEQAQAAGILSDSYTQLTEVPIDEYQAAVSQMLQQGVADLGLANNTMNEAFSTLSGSLSMAKGAWSNLVTGLADENADLEALTDNFITSVETAANNILPIVDRVITNLVSVLEEKGPDIVAGGAKLLGKLAAGAIKAIPVIISSIPEIIDAIIEGFKESDLDIIEIGADIVRGIWQGISSLAGWIGRKVAGFFDGLFSGVKEHEQIHSPSKKWAFIGKNDALGIASGWDEAFPDVKKRMMDGLDFNTESIGVSASVTGGANGSGGFSVAPQTFVLQLPNGDALASFLVDILRGEARLA